MPSFLVGHFSVCIFGGVFNGVTLAFYGAILPVFQLKWRCGYSKYAIPTYLVSFGFRSCACHMYVDLAFGEYSNCTFILLYVHHCLT